MLVTTLLGMLSDDIKVVVFDGWVDDESPCKIIARGTPKEVIKGINPYAELTIHRMYSFNENELRIITN